MEFIDIRKLVGKTLTSIKGGVGSDELILTTTEGVVYKMFHDQHCCEYVYVQDIIGDLNDLVGTTIIQAEEVTSDKHPEGYKPDGYIDSFTWTFYKFATIKGYVTIRWLGESNGYYSESVEIIKW